MENKFHGFTPQNVNISKALAFVDDDMNFVNCMENFHRFLGVQREHECLYNLICEADAVKLKEMLADITDNGCICFQTEMCRIDGKRRGVSLKITRLPYSDKAYTYSVELLDSENCHDYIYDLEFKTVKYKKILENQGNMVFEYDADCDELKIFSLKPVGEEVIFTCTLQNFQTYIQTMDLSQEDKERLLLFCLSLKNKDSYIEYVFSKNPFDSNAEDGAVIIRGSNTLLSEKRAICVGSINTYTTGEGGCASAADSVDMMTGLLNKKAILNLARTAVEEKKYNQVFLVMIDLDNFKMVNDNYGHMIGDKVIKNIADILKLNVKQHGWTGRFGGDEYFAVLYDLGGEGDLRAILGSIMYNIENCYRDKFDGFNLSCSIGVSEYPRNGDNFDLLFKKADRGLYIAKKKGKKRYIIYKEELHGEIDLNANDEEYVRVLEVQRFAGDIKRFRLMRDGIAALAIQGISYMDQFMENIISAYCLTGISLYLGDDFKLAGQWGSYSSPMRNIDYMHSKNARSRFNEKDVFWENNVQFNGFYVPVINDKLLKHNINSTVQCIIRCGGDIKGVMTFDVETPMRNWTEEDTHYFGVVSQLAGNIWLKSE